MKWIIIIFIILILIIFLLVSIQNTQSGYVIKREPLFQVLENSSRDIKNTIQDFKNQMNLFQKIFKINKIINNDQSINSTLNQQQVDELKNKLYEFEKKENN